MRFSFVGPVDVRTFRESLAYVVDVTSMEARAPLPDVKPKSDELAEVAADIAARAKAPPAVEAPQTVPARPAPAAASEPGDAPPAAAAPVQPRLAADEPRARLRPECRRRSRARPCGCRR